MEDFSEYKLRKDAADVIAEKLLSDFISNNPEYLKNIGNPQFATALGNNLAVTYFTLVKALHTGQTK